jgi:hypothetical protein
VNKTPNRRSCSHRNAARHSPSVALRRWSSALARLLGSISRSTLTCFVMPADLGWLTRATIREIQAYLRHSNIQNTTRYTAAAAVQGVLPRLKFGEFPPIRVTITAGRTVVTMPASACPRFCPVSALGHARAMPSGLMRRHVWEGQRNVGASRCGPKRPTTAESALNG